MKTKFGVGGEVPTGTGVREQPKPASVRPPAGMRSLSEGDIRRIPGVTTAEINAVEPQEPDPSGYGDLPVVRRRRPMSVRMPTLIICTIVAGVMGILLSRFFAIMAGR